MSEKPATGDSATVHFGDDISLQDKEKDLPVSTQRRHEKHRLMHLIHPSGKHYHIVHHVRDIDDKRKQVFQQHDDHSNFDVVVYGTPEHLSCVRDIQQHQIHRWQTLKQAHPEIHQEFSEVHETLDHLSEELNHLTDHAVALDASFNKFGYHAQMRTIDGDEESASLTHTETSSSQQSYLDRSLQPLRFWKTPTIRQYFHKGLLWRSPESGEVGSFELFTDLIYVGVIDVIGEIAVSRASAETFLHFCIIFALSYKIWSDLTVTVNWFEVEDCVGRLGILFVLICLYGFNSNIEHFFEDTLASGISYFLAARFFFITFNLVTSCSIKMIRGFLIVNAAYAILTSILYIASVHIAYPYNLITLFLAIFLDYTLPMTGFLTTRIVKNSQNSLLRWFSTQFEFIPAINIEHRCERTSAFTTLVFGYSVLKSLYQSQAHIGVNAFLGKGILSVIQAFVIMWLYFDIDGWAIHVHAIRRHWGSSALWIMSHLPLSAGFILASSALGELVLAHDCGNANVEDLAEGYAEGSAGEIDQTLRWFYCVGLGVTLLTMSIISATHIHKKLNQPRLTKTFRLVMRCGISLILILLPLAEDLNSLSLVAITTSLFVFVLTLDIFGNSCSGQKFWTGGRCKDMDSRCKYTARIKMSKRRKAELQQRLVDGKDIDLNQALRRTGSTDSSATAVDVDEEWHHHQI